jgi:heptosyltransferase-2
MSKVMSKMRTLVISPNWIGDAVMAQPLLRMLKQQHPERPIDVLAPPQVVPVWRRIQEADDILVTPVPPPRAATGRAPQVRAPAARRGYSDAYVLPNTLKYALIPWLARIPRRVGYKGEMRYGMINVMHTTTPPRSMVPFYAALAREPELPSPSPARPSLVVGGEESDDVRTRLGLSLVRPLVVFAPGAEFGIAKRWPPATTAPWPAAWRPPCRACRSPARLAERQRHLPGSSNRPAAPPAPSSTWPARPRWTTPSP